MSTLYNELPSSLDDIIRNLPALEKQKTAQRQTKNQEANLGKINVMHNEVCQQLGIKKTHTQSVLADGTHECTLRWSFYDDVQMAQRVEEVTATASNKNAAKGKANQAMLIKQGHLPDLDDDFHREVADLRQASEDGLVSEVVPRAVALMERTASNASTYAFFLPEVLRAVLAEDDYGGLSELLSALRRCLGDEGIPVDLWEELLDESSFSMRHYHLANSSLTQLSGFDLAKGAFPGEMERQYYKKFRHLLALERHGGLLHGIQQYELDPRMFCSVPLVDVHKMEADKVVLTAVPEAGVADLIDGNRSLRNSDLILLVPLEALDDLQGAAALPEGGYQRSANWQHPGAWLAAVTNVKGDSRDSRGSGDVRVHTRRISRFASDLNAGAEADGPQLTAPIAPGRQYRLFHIAMETPTARMLGALRCLCRVQLPAWSENFEGRKPSFHFSDGMRQSVLAVPQESLAQASGAARMALGAASSDQILERLCSPGERFASLTPTQRRAVQRAMDEQLSIIQGPPGTGKTHVACAVIAGWVERYARLGERILAVADSNVAADNMYRRLENFGIQAVRVGQGKDVETLMGDELWHAVKNAQVIIATCIGSGMEMLESRAGVKYFHRVVIDECTQACEPAALVALGRSAEQAVLIGDHNQLPATVLSRPAKDAGLGTSLFERMVLSNGLLPTLLIEQRRMHSSIAEFPNMTFYNSQLVNAVEDSTLAPIPGFPWPNADCRVCFVDVAGSEQKRGYSSYNTGEAEAVAQVVAQLVEAGVPASELVVLTAYLAQRDEIRRAIGDRSWQAQLNVSIDTIDGYQGMERDIVLFSAARSNAERTLGFLADSRRMNVMLTRARRGIIVFGHGDMLRQSRDTGSHWGAWLNWVESKGAVVSAANLSQQQSSMMTSSPYTAPAQQAAIGGAFTNAPLFGDSSSPAPNGAPAPPPPLPQNQWQKVYSEQYGRHYYWNTATQQTQWDTPAGM